MSGYSHYCFRSIVLAGCASLFLGGAALAQGSGSVRFDIPAEDLGGALNQMAQQSHSEIIFDADIARGKRSAPLHGNYTRQEALARILAGSGLRARYTSSGSIIVESIPKPNDLRETSSATQVGAVVVTARRREERLIDVPVAATVLSRGDLDRYNPTDISQLNTLVPTLDIVKTITGAGGGLILRGLASSQGDSGVEQKVAVSLDGVTSNSGGIIDLSLLDVRDIQVLKGPQSLFFGKSAAAGVIAIDSVSPGDVVEGYARTSYDTADHTFLGEGAISVPLTDTLAMRIAFRASTSRGYVFDQATPMPDPYVFGPPGPSPLTRAPTDRWGPGLKEGIGRVTLVWKPTKDFDATLKLAGDDQRTNGVGSYFEVVACPPGDVHPVLLGIPDLNQTCAQNYRTGTTSLPAGIGLPLDPEGTNFEKDKVLIGGLTLNYRLPNITFTSITGYQHYNVNAANNFTLGNLTDLFGASIENNDVWSEELRGQTTMAGPINFTAGLYFEDGHRAFQQETHVLQFFADPATGRWDTSDIKDFTSDLTYSGFAEANWKILPSLELAGGARYTYERKQGSVGNIFVNPAPSGGGAPASLLPQGERIFASVSANNVSPEVTLTWHPIGNATLYAAYKTGFLSGGISNSGNLTNNYNSTNVVFKPETVRGGEFGAKAALLGNRLRVDFDAYQYKYYNLQVTSFDNATFAYSIRNAATAVSQGVELEGQYISPFGVGLHGFGSYNDAHYVSFPGAQCYTGQTAATGCVNGVQNLAGAPLAASPKWSGNIGATYDQPIGNNLAIGMSADLYYYGPYNITATENYQPGEEQGSHVQLNAAIRLYRGSHDGWELAVIGRNLTGAKYVTLAFDAPGGAPGVIDGSLGRPREFLLQATYNFGR